MLAWRKKSTTRRTARSARSQKGAGFANLRSPVAANSRFHSKVGQRPNGADQEGHVGISSASRACSEPKQKDARAIETSAKATDDQERFESQLRRQSFEAAGPADKAGGTSSARKVQRQTLTEKDLLASRTRCGLYSKEQNGAAQRVWNEVQSLNRQTWIYCLSRVHCRKYARCEATHPGGKALGTSDRKTPGPGQRRQRLSAE